jgi:3-deoxy-7-phosphoheptulonate synthase/chorismate mutase
MTDRQIAKRRQQIDSLDRRLLQLLSQRTEIVRELGVLKRRAGLPLRDRTRESTMLERLRTSSPGPLDDDGVVGIFRRILRESRRMQGGMAKNSSSSVRRDGRRDHDH